MWTKIKRFKFLTYPILSVIFILLLAHVFYGLAISAVCFISWSPLSKEFVQQFMPDWLLVFRILIVMAIVLGEAIAFADFTSNI